MLTQTQTDDHREPPTLAEIVREKTNDGLVLLNFYIEALQGKLEGFDAAHRLEAAQALLELVVDAALLQRRWDGTTLAMVLGGDLGLFRKIVKFQVDIVEGGGEDFTLPRRVLLAEQLRNCRALVDSADAGGRFSKVFGQETGDGARIERFLSDVAAGKVAGSTPADLRSARDLLDDTEYQDEFVPCEAPDCSVDWRDSILDPAYVSQALEEGHAECGCSDDGEFV